MAGINDVDGNVARVSTSGELLVRQLSGALIPVAYNEITLSYTGSNLTGVVYKSSGVTVATLTLGYTGANLTSVVRS